MRIALVALLAVGSWAAPAADKSPAPLYGAPAAPSCPLKVVEVSTGYGCQESQECETKYDEKCETEYEQQCETKYEQQCATKYESVCNTVYEDKCETGYETKCSTVYNDKCHNKCETGYETG